MKRETMERLVDALGVPDMRLPRPDIDPKDLGKLNPARLSPDSARPMLPAVAGTYKYVTKTADGGTREVDSGIPYFVSQWGSDGRPAEIKPLITTPEQKQNWETYQEKLDAGTSSLGHQLQRQEVKRILEKERADSRNTAITNSYRTPAEQDLIFESKVMAGVAARRWDTMSPDQQVEHASRMAAQIGLELAYVPRGYVYDDKGNPVEQRAFIARHAWGIMYGPCALTELCKRLELDVREKERQREQVALSAAHYKSIGQATVTSVWVNDRFVSGDAA
jgi:hypothetical protein